MGLDGYSDRTRQKGVSCSSEPDVMDLQPYQGLHLAQLPADRAKQVDIPTTGIHLHDHYNPLHRDFPDRTVDSMHVSTGFLRDLMATNAFY